MIAAVLWVIGALAILVTGRVPTAIAKFVAMKVDYQFQLVAYHLSLVESYPSLADPRPGHRPRSDMLWRRPPTSPDLDPPRDVAGRPSICGGQWTIPAVGDGLAGALPLHGGAEVIPPRHGRAATQYPRNFS